MPRTLFDKIWATHEIRSLGERTSLLFLDRVFMHERTGSIALASLAEADRAVANVATAFATMDHIIDTFPGRNDSTLMPSGTDFIRSLRHGAREAGIRLFDLDDPLQGIAHMIAAEQGIALPGLTLVCPDSHTCTLGALGTLAWGIGTSDCEHALATETLRTRRPQQMRVWFDGQLRDDVSAKDLILHLIARYGAAGGRGCAIEFAGPAISALPMNGRFTLCNMAVEFSAFTGIIAPDSRTFDYLDGRPYAPRGASALRARRYWQSLCTDTDAHFDHELRIDASACQPMVSWGTSPGQSIGVAEPIPAPQSLPTQAEQAAAERAQAYMAVTPGERLVGVPIDAAFIGSCTNSRLADLRTAAKVVAGHRVAPGVRAICVPGSTTTKRAAEAEGLDRVFIDAGFEWRESGCSLCFYAGGEGFEPGQRVISTTNRNFEGRQGPGVRTHLASPATVAASAIVGSIQAAERVGHASV
ncbi:MAG: 3-isopropylmalate dehydratase large subunit [Pseudomonadota bacterium]